MSFGIKDAIDILVVATLMFYTYRMMKESGTINIFYGVLAFIVAWVLMSEILDMRLIGTIMDMFVNIGLIIIVILFQDQIKRFLVEIGSHKRWQWINGLFKRDTGTETQEKKWILSVVYACMNMAKSKTGALIVIQQKMLLDDYEHTGEHQHTAHREYIFQEQSPSRRRNDNSRGTNSLGRVHLAGVTRHQPATQPRSAPPLGFRHCPSHRCRSNSRIGRNG